ncbi:hypothetical protein EMCG_05408 [[Emmonsia] crescens]|uniref:Uncharacterized protein n=1 Tax=[Emmonsia] crescens TaxID=73230 RepID=A0A0G2IXK6_9EURO|nr:hypothetical protein EMCG_05408 [Emmonsia crescens UAMH 3008]
MHAGPKGRLESLARCKNGPHAFRVHSGQQSPRRTPPESRWKATSTRTTRPPAPHHRPRSDTTPCRSLQTQIR